MAISHIKCMFSLFAQLARHTKLLWPSCVAQPSTYLPCLVAFILVNKQDWKGKYRLATQPSHRSCVYLVMSAV